MYDIAMHETIAALATAPGMAGIAIVRVSGERAEETLRMLFVQKNPPKTYRSHMLYYGKLFDEKGQVDECMAVLMRAPKSYTKEDVVEFHLHGGALVSKRLLNALRAMGIRMAEPGEFTLRAFLKGRIDLSEAEAVMRLIHANGEKASTAALRQLNGGASQFVSEIQEEVITMLATIEAAIDFPDEVEETEEAPHLANMAKKLSEILYSACDERSARLLQEGLQVVLCGKPNVGKSTLLNTLLQEERAIVTEIPGTTRDIVRGSIILEGLTIHLLDTAGIHETSERVEQIGVDLAVKAVQQADVILLCQSVDVEETHTMDESDPLYEILQAKPYRTVYTKADLQTKADIPQDALFISAHSGHGIEELKQYLLSCAKNVGESPLTMERHIALARKAAECLQLAQEAFLANAPMEFPAMELNEALQHLKAITGEQVDEKMLDDIFSRFCVGK